MILFSVLRLKKHSILLLFILFAGILIIYHSKDNENKIIPEIPVIPSLILPDLDQFQYLPGTAIPCSPPSGPNLLIFIHSSPSHIPHRTAIRDTWGSPKYQKIKTVFVVGRSVNEKVWQRIQQEAKEHRDLVLIDLIDSYKNLTLKHLLGIKWIITNCPQAHYVLKSDDDVFVDTKRLSSVIELVLGDHSGSKDSLVCHVIPEGTSPRRTGKWMVTQEEYPYKEFPEYCSGLAYFTRMTSLKKIYDIAYLGGVPYLGIDDIFVTGLAASLARVGRQDLGVRFATTEEPVIKWMKNKSLYPCPWMIAEISSYYWPKHAFTLWNKTITSWMKMDTQVFHKQSF